MWFNQSMPQAYYRLGLVGYPLEHSRSPVIHAAALKAIGLAGEYLLYPVRPLPDGQAELEQLVRRLREGELAGLNVTIPHKQALLPLVDCLTPAAQEIGAVNTLYKREDQVWGDNTDAPGFLADLFHLAPELAETIAQPEGKLTPRAHRALLLGAGGSARAVVYALISNGWEVAIAARRFDQAQEMANNFTSTMARRSSLQAITLSFNDLAAFLGKLGGAIDLIVNTTPLGMKRAGSGESQSETPPGETGSGEPEAALQSPWPSGLAFPQDARVYDLVYNPPQTELIRTAQLNGLRACNGLGMLIEQAALALEIWTGQAIPRQVMFEVVREDSGRRGEHLHGDRQVSPARGNKDGDPAI